VVNSPTKSQRKYIVPAVERAIQILQLLNQEPEGLTISQISQALALHKSTVFTILNTLSLYRLVERTEDTGRYQLGMALFTLGSQVVERLNIRTVADPILKQLVRQTGLTVHLGILDEGEVVYIEKLEGNGPIKVSSRVGHRVGLHCTALGKAILAHLSEAERRQQLARQSLLKRTSNTITSLEMLQADLERSKAQGFSFDDEENEPGIRCLGAPVYNYRQEVVCALSLSGPRDLISRSCREKLAKQLKQAALEISQALGFTEGNSHGE
jgi:DNA-binding IclR family transcriptional regulator